MPKVTLASNGAWDLNTSSLPYTSTLLPTVTLDLSGVLFRSSKIPSFPSTGGPIPSPASLSSTAERLSMALLLIPVTGSAPEAPEVPNPHSHEPVHGQD